MGGREGGMNEERGRKGEVGREGGTEGGMERGTERRMEGGRESGREGGRVGGKEGVREGGRYGRKERLKGNAANWKESESKQRDLLLLSLLAVGCELGQLPLQTSYFQRVLAVCLLCTLQEYG